MPLDLYAYALATGDTLLEKLCLQFLAWNFEAWPRVPTDLLQIAAAQERPGGAQRAGPTEGLWTPGAGGSAPPFNLSLYWSHKALFQRNTLQALEFHTVPFQLLARYKGLNPTEDAYKPRIYTSPTWSASVTDSSWSARKSQRVYQSRRGPLVKYSSNYFQASSDYRYYPYQSFQTPQHPSFLFQDKRVSWSLVYLPTIQSCWDYTFSCSSDELPVLGLTKSGGSDRTIAYENKALMLCEGLFVADGCARLLQSATSETAAAPSSSGVSQEKLLTKSSGWPPHPCPGAQLPG
ncbi:hypothetical protein H8959_019793 [Pygathrix nigripes]